MSTVRSEEHKLIDLTSLKEMTGNDTAFVKELLTLFLLKNKEDVEQLNTASNEGRWQDVQFIAHRMRSSVAPFGMSETLSRLKSLELEIKSGITEQADEKVRQIIADCTKAEKEANKLLTDNTDL